MSVYTRTGDQGSTSLVDGTRVRKDDPRLEAYGTVDELMSHLGLVATLPGLDDRDRRELLEAQDRLMTGASLLAAGPGDIAKRMPSLAQGDIDALEREIDRLSAELPPLRSFVLPGGSAPVAQIHIARCVCRRAERRCVALDDAFQRHEITIKYLNRLSDYLFVLSRTVSERNGTPQNIWTPRI